MIDFPFEGELFDRSYSPAEQTFYRNFCVPQETVDLVTMCKPGPLGYVYDEMSLEFLELHGLLVDPDTGNVVQDADQPKVVKSIFFSCPPERSISLGLTNGTIISFRGDRPVFVEGATAVFRPNVP